MDQLKWQKAQAEAEKIAKSMEATTKTPADLDKVAKERGLTVVETALFLRERADSALGAQPELSGRVFAMKEGEVTPAMRVAARLGVRAPSPASRTRTCRSWPKSRRACAMT